MLASPASDAFSPKLTRSLCIILLLGIPPMLKGQLVHWQSPLSPSDSAFIQELKTELYGLPSTYLQLNLFPEDTLHIRLDSHMHTFVLILTEIAGNDPPFPKRSDFESDSSHIPIWKGGYQRVGSYDRLYGDTYLIMEFQRPTGSLHACWYYYKRLEP